MFWKYAHCRLQVQGAQRRQQHLPSAFAAEVCVNNWAGRRELDCEVVKETKTRYVCRLLSDGLLPRVRCFRSLTWNRHDADALVAVYAEGGTYHNPRLDHALTGQAIGDFAKSVWAAYPDMSLEIISRGDTGGGLVAVQWVLHGTHTGPFMDGTPPTGRAVAYPGASFTQVDGDKIRSEHTYLDRQTVAEQLGLKAK